MDFLSDIFITYWKEVIITLLLTATLPFFQQFFRKLIAAFTASFTSKRQLQQALSESERKRSEAESQLSQAREDFERKYQEAERKYQAEAEGRRKAEEELERLRKELEKKRVALEEAERKSQAIAAEQKQAQSQPEKTQPAPSILTAKLLELLKACEALPYPQKVKFLHVDAFLWSFLRPTEDVLRIKVMRAIDSYVGSKEWRSPEEALAQVECTVFYVLMILAQGVSEKQISLDDSAKLTWKKASALLDKVNGEYFKEHPEVLKPSDYTIREGKNIIASAFGGFPPEVVIEDKTFIRELLPATKTD